MTEIRSICKDFPDLIFTFKSYHGETHVTILKERNGIKYAKSYTICPYTRSEIAQANLEAYAREVQDRWLSQYQDHAN